MASFERVITTFTRGELSRRALARVDFEGRFDGVEKLENYFVHIQGGAQKRAGTRFVAAAKDETNLVRLIAFEVSVEQNYMIEASNLAFRFYAEEGQVKDNGSPVETVTPYTHNDLPRLKWTQSADVLFLGHPNHNPRELRRTDPVTFDLTDYTFKDGPYLEINETDTTLELNGTTGSVTVTASATTGINNDQGFLATDVGRLIRWKDPDGNWTWLKITSHTDTTHVDADIMGEDASAGTATTEWRLGAWSDTTGWPSVCTFHQSRLWWGRTTRQPQTLWASEVGNFNSFAPSEPDGTVADDLAINITIDSNQVNAIAWMMSSQRGLQVGTIGEEWVVRSADTTTGLSPLNVEVVPQGSWGSSDFIAPVRVGSSSVYVQRGSTVVRESAFNFDEDAYTATNITVLSEHLFRKGVERLSFVQTPVQTVWTLLSDGSLAGFTFDKDQKVQAWHHHTIAGSAAGAAQVLDIASIETEHVGRHHEHLWLVVRRTIDGQQRQYIEFLEAPFDAALDSIEDGYFVDSGLSYSGTPETTITGLDHLEGETVTVLADGSPHPSKIVMNGEIVLDRPASEVHAGLPFIGEIVTLPLEAPQREGPFVSIGKTKRIHQVAVFLSETVGVKIGAVDGPLDTVPFRSSANPMDQPVPPHDGVKSLSLESSWQQTPRVRIVSDQPLPCTILAIVIESQIYGS